MTWILASSVLQVENVLFSAHSVKKPTIFFYLELKKCLYFQLSNTIFLFCHCNAWFYWYVIGASPHINDVGHFSKFQIFFGLLRIFNLQNTSSHGIVTSVIMIQLPVLPQKCSYITTKK